MSPTKPLLFIVDDNKDILFNLKIMLEGKDYDVLTASTGQQALEILIKQDIIPDVIISDIMMPNMSGYEFFAAVSSYPKLNHIPFLFLTAKSTPEDIRLGKMLGVDDYITKPFNEEDLLASISGKIIRNRKSKQLNEKLIQLLSSIDKESQASISKNEDITFCLLLMFWDDIAGPVLEKSFPLESDCHISINTIGKQLFHSATSIYGNNRITTAEGILLNIENIKNKGYLLFDSFPKEGERFGEKQYMLSVIAPNITYFDSLKIKEILQNISEKIKNEQDWDIKQSWKQISEILTSGSLLVSPH
ncbi:MAG: two-component system response regulator [Promethearchaeota archaeon]